ncbi:hypothetical protein BO86DRAFT_412028 [Aspergillus japonicus CBS 114.51]|uniref:Uncharacterized protein n=1 Tax=Aspergillus japonicus CBS 114.51 TaxID=1448312 RepID=A0A8T8WSS4_ASPJA|nr:hypothetical protein BO86DRAFT_412028 [Aspergillus japonicus CBS 114.51]RAH78851.1 hypothetical protein BO86DRAFT_412028 [Aspergillus japonicus CBS 114.51]
MFEACGELWGCDGGPNQASSTSLRDAIIFKSGIGPTGVAVPPAKDWISLLVVVGLIDHSIFSIVVKTSCTFNELDAEAILIGTATGQIHSYQDLNAGDSCTPTAEGVVTITAYMTHELTSVGVLRLDTSQKKKTIFEVSPYLQTAGDREAGTLFVQSMVDAITAPGTGLELQEYTNTSALLCAEWTISNQHSVPTPYRRHTLTFLRLGLWYIVDGGIHPDLASGNNRAYVMVVAENE